MASIISAGTTSGTALNMTADTSGQLQLATGASATTAVTIDTSQNVGIGTTSPLCKLAIGAGSLSDPNVLAQINAATSSATYLGLNKGGTYGGLIGYSNGGTGSTGLHIRNVAADPILFYVNNTTEAMRIDSSGKLLVGSGTSPSAGSATMLVASSVGGGIQLANTTGNNGGLINAVGGSGLIFYGYTGAVGSETYTERMRIDSNGYLLIGYTSSNGAYKLQVNSQIFATSSTIATSDARYKTDVTPISGALDIVNDLNPVEFNWKKHPVHAFDTTNKTVGFLAQEVQEVLKDKPYVNSIIKKNDCIIEPEEKDEDGNVTKEAVTEEFLGIAEGNMIAILTKAIQEQQTIINDLKSRIETLEGAKS
jgi:hypothetical protein